LVDRRGPAAFDRRAARHDVRSGFHGGSGGDGGARCRHGPFHLVEADIAAGRLVALFDMVLPQDAGYYVVTPEATADLPKIAKIPGMADRLGDAGGVGGATRVTRVVRPRLSPRVRP